MEEWILWKLLPKANYRFNAIPIKIAMAFLTELEQKFLQFVQKHKISWITNAILRKKNGTGALDLLDFRLYKKLFSSRQYGSGTNTKNIYNNETIQKTQRYPTHLWPPYIWQRRQEYTMQKSRPIQMTPGNLDSCM